MSLTSDEVERPNPPRRGVRKGLYLIPSAFTAANIGMGFFSVMESLRGFQLLGSAHSRSCGGVSSLRQSRNRDWLCFVVRHA